MILRVHGRPSLEATVQSVVDAVVDVTTFQVAAVSVVQTDGYLRTLAVAGSAEAHRQLTGKLTALARYEEEFAVADSWGTLLFVPHDRMPAAAEPGWVPDGPIGRSRRAWHPLDTLYAPLRAPSGDLVGVLSVDLPTNRKRPRRWACELLELLAAQAGIAIDNARLADDLRAGEELFRLAFDSAGTGMAMISLVSADFGSYLRVNPSFCRIAGRSERELTGMTASEVTHPDDRGMVEVNLRQLADGTRSFYQREKRYLRGDGSSVWVLVTVTHIATPHGPARHAICQVEDITTRRALTVELQHRAHHDPLTDLPNRAALLLRLGQAIELAHHGRRPGALFFIDLDKFKDVNDVYGHLLGDQALTIVATRLAAAVRPNDMAARLGGDEFLVIADDLDDGAVADLRVRLVDSIRQPIRLPGGHLVTIGASVGVATIPPDGADALALLRAADRAMYTSKNAGTALPTSEDDDEQVG